MRIEAALRCDVKRYPIRSRARGFSLVELLVVTSIVAMLVAIVAPSLRRARGFGWPDALRDAVHAQTCASVELSWEPCRGRIEVHQVDLNGDARNELLLVARVDELRGYSGAYPILGYAVQEGSWARVLEASGVEVAVSETRHDGHHDLVITQPAGGCQIDLTYGLTDGRYTRRESHERCP